MKTRLCYVLIPSYKLSDYAKFVSEFELEHGGVKNKDSDRFPEPLNWSRCTSM